MPNIKLKTLNILSILLIIFDIVLTPFPVLAEKVEQYGLDSDSIYLFELQERAIISAGGNIKTSRGFEDDTIYNSSIIDNIESALPSNSNAKILDSAIHTITAYTSETSQCDNSPCITANGFNLCDHGIEDSVAANFLPFGTKVRIPEFFGNRIFYVRDRMSRRHGTRIDIWMTSKSEALKFGKRRGVIEILE